MVSAIRFNGHPPLGVNATIRELLDYALKGKYMFQWAPTLGGECYSIAEAQCAEARAFWFQWAPTLGGECYVAVSASSVRRLSVSFQWAPTLGGECYFIEWVRTYCPEVVSMGTHPWG